VGKQGNFGDTMPPRKFIVVAAGRAYTDVVARVNPDFLKKYNIPADSQRECTVAMIQQIQAELLQEELIVAGGSSANIAAMVTTLGGKAGFFGKVYDDDTGNNFIHDLQSRNVEFCCNHYDKTVKMSGTCLVLLTHELRSFVYNTGCSDNFLATDFDQFDFSTAYFFLIEAHLLTSPVAKKNIAKALELAKEKSRIVINLHGIVLWDNEHIESARLIAATADIVIGNEMEHQAFDAAERLFQLPRLITQIKVITKAEQGAEAIQLGAQNYHAPAIPPIKLVSTVGAGDAFCGGLLFCLARGSGIQESLIGGTVTASIILEQTGARLSPSHSLKDLFKINRC
jgi:sugar/nucleoside kinase (ribokinase family)